MSIKVASSLQVPPSAINVDDTYYRLRYEPVEFVKELVGKSNIVRVPFGQRDLYVLNHPDFIRDIFVGNPSSFGKRKDQNTEQAYLQQISGILPLLDHTEIAGYAPVILSAAERASRRWNAQFAESGPFVVDLYRELGRITLEIVIQTLFGADAGKEAKELFDAILALDSGYGFNPVEATLGEFLPPLVQSDSARSTEALAFIENYIGALARQTTIGSPFLAQLVKYMGPEKAASIGMTVMLGMHEVTNTTLPWAWLLLNQHPDAEARLHSELQAIEDGVASASADISSLSWMNMVLDETRRLYPSVWMIVRFVRQDHLFGDVVVPAGSIVLASQSVMHRDARYFPEPDRFDPLRWTPDARRQRPEFSYFPFSAGPRACAGREFAIVEDALVLATLARHWNAKAATEDLPKPVPQKSNAPVSGLRMILDRRSAESLSMGDAA